MTRAERSQRNVEGPVADLLVELVYGDYSLPTLTFAAVKGGTWDVHSLAEYEGRLRFDESGLKLLIDVTEGAFGALFEMMEARNKPATVALSDGSTVTAEFAHMGHLGKVADIDLYQWTWHTLTPTRFWLGNLGGTLPNGGNLSIASGGRSQHCAYRLEGRFTWYLLPARGNGDRHVLLDAGGELPTRDALVWDLLSMQFCFGTSLTLGHLVGVDGSGRAVAAMTPGHLVRPAGGRRSPVPDDIIHADVWIPELFHRLSAKFHANGWEPIIIAVAAYLDSEADHLDGAYLKAQVGLEAFAKRLVGAGKPGVLVQDETAWKKWVKTLGPTIQQHLVDPARLDVVLGKFVSAMFAPTGELVRRALTAHGVTLPPDVVAEIKKRNYPVHEFLMNGEMKHDIDVDARRVETIQTLLAALVACHVGYGGPLKGYVVDADGHRPSPEWWPVTLTSEGTSVQYHAGTPLP